MTSNRTEKDFAGQELRSKSFVGMDLSYADFRGAILKECTFEGCDLSFADFSQADLYRVNLSNTRLYVTQFRGADLTRTEFTGANLYGIKLFDADVTRAVFDRIVTTEKVANSPSEFEMASEVYNTLKRAFRSHGEIDIAANYYFRQRVCKRKSYTNKFKGFLELLFLDWLVGYGEKPERSIYWALLWIFLFAGLYLVLPFFGSGVYATVSNGSQQLLSNICQFPLALVFSISAFVGADLLGWEQYGVARLIMPMEALIGYTMLAIILISFSRKIVRD
ncbi:MAG: pentapeptide repeat-containing protein [Dehalococcoidia bacterium]